MNSAICNLLKFARSYGNSPPQLDQMSVQVIEKIHSIFTGIDLSIHSIIQAEEEEGIGYLDFLPAMKILI